MIKKIDIEGMKCGHCSSAVKKALEALSGVVKADVSHETGKAVVELSENVSDDALTKAVTDEDFTVKGIE